MGQQCNIMIQNTSSILVIDDDEFQLNLLSHGLQTLGFQHIETATCGADALELIGNEVSAHTLVFCDLQMPGIDGIEVLRELHALRYPGYIVLVSGEDQQILGTALRLGEELELKVADALVKPITQRMLKNCLNGIVDDSRGLKNQNPDDSLDPAALQEVIAQGWLVLHYQPKISIKNRQVVGVEALVRCEHPDFGIIAPSAFIDVAEESGLIEQLTNSVISIALNQSAEWRNSGEDLSVAINLSMNNLQQL